MDNEGILSCNINRMFTVILYLKYCWFVRFPRFLFGTCLIYVDNYFNYSFSVIFLSDYRSRIYGLV